jgi:hypothetical protein
MADQAGLEASGAAEAAAPAAAAAAAPPGRERRSRGGLQITDERLLWALQNEALGNDTWQMAKPTQQKRPKSSADTGGSSLKSGEASTAKPRQQASAGGTNGGKKQQSQQQQQQQQRSQQSVPQAKASSAWEPPAPTRPAPPAAGPAPTKPTPAQEEASIGGGSSSGRPAKRIKAMLVADHYMAATLSDRWAGSGRQGDRQGGSGSAGRQHPLALTSTCLLVLPSQPADPCALQADSRAG